MILIHIIKILVSHIHQNTVMSDERMLVHKAAFSSFQQGGQ